MFTGTTPSKFSLGNSSGNLYQMVLSFNSFTCSIFCLFFGLLLHMLTYSKEKLVSRKKSKKKLTKYQKRNGSPTDSPKNRVTLEELNASSSHDLVPLEEVMNLLEAETEVLFISEYGRNMLEFIDKKLDSPLPWICPRSQPEG